MSDLGWRIAGWVFRGVVGLCTLAIAIVMIVFFGLCVVGLFVSPHAVVKAEKPVIQNLYRPGTRGYELAEFAKIVLPATVTPYFVMAKDRALFLGQTDPEKLGKMISSSALEALQKDISIPPRAAALASYTFDENHKDQRSVCQITFVDPARAIVGSTLMHELMHCRIGVAELQPRYKRVVVPKVGGLVPGIPPGAALSMFEEIQARAMSLSYIVNYGVKQDAEFFKSRLADPYPSNPGVHSLARVIQICLLRDRCSIEPGPLAETLLDDQEFVRLLKLDFQQNHAVNLAAGFR